MKGTPASPATAREQRLTRTGGTLEEHAARRLRADLRELFRVLEEVDDLDELELGRLAAGDVVERDAGVRLHLNFVLVLEHAHGPAGPAHAARAAHAAAAVQEEETA